MGRPYVRPQRPAAPDDTDDTEAVAALAEIFTEEAERLRASIRSRLGSALRGRVDADDILQESYLAAVARLRHRRDADREQLLGWVRFIVDQTLIDMQRFHLVAARRSVLRERSTDQTGGDGVDAFAPLRLARNASPVDGIIRGERIEATLQAIGQLGEVDRYLIVARCVRGLSNAQVSELLHLTPENTAVRLTRAKQRVRDLIDAPDTASD